MLITTEAVLAMRCPECGKLEVHDISRFAFSGGKSLQINCSCGTAKLVIRAGRRSYWLQVSCVVCETRHQQEIAGKALWNSGVTRLFCPEVEMELGYIGSELEVREVVKSSEVDLEALIEEFEQEDYFHNPLIMCDVLNCLHDIASSGALYCQCDSQRIEVNVFPDRLELHCKNCDGIYIIYAENEEDLEVIQQVDTIELSKHGFKCLDSLVSTSKVRKTRRRRKT